MVLLVPKMESSSTSGWAEVSINENAQTVVLLNKKTTPLRYIAPVSGSDTYNAGNMDNGITINGHYPIFFYTGVNPDDGHGEYIGYAESTSPTFDQGTVSNIRFFDRAVFEGLPEVFSMYVWNGKFNLIYDGTDKDSDRITQLAVYDITNTPPATVLTPNASSTSPGGQISVGWNTQRLADNFDWIALVPTGQSWNQNMPYQDTNGAKNGTATFTVPSGASSVQFVYYVDKSFGEIARSNSISVNISSSTPTLTFTASSSSITLGQSSTLTWSSTNATSCTASGDWSGTQNTSGTKTVSPTATSTYTLTCTGSGGTATQSVTVTVSAVQEDYGHPHSFRLFCTGRRGHERFLTA